MSSPSSRGWQEIRVSIALSVLSVLAVVLRFIARWKKSRKFELDDWLSLAGLVRQIYPNGSATGSLLTMCAQICIGAMLIEEILCEAQPPVAPTALGISWKKVLTT